MYHIKEDIISWRILLRVGDLLGVTMAIPLAFWASHYIDAVPTPTANRITILNCFFAVGLQLYDFHRLGLYRSRSFLNMGPMIRRLLLSMVLVIITYVVLREVAAPHVDFSYVYFVILYAIICFFLVLSIRLLIRFVEIRFLRSMRVERIAFVGWSFRTGKVLKGLAKELLHNQSVDGYFELRDKPDLHPPEEMGFRNLGTLDDLPRVLVDHGITSLILDQREISSEQLQKIALICADLIVSLRMIPWSSDIWTDGLTVHVVDGVPLIGLKDLRIDRSGNRIARRIVDIAGALVGLILSAPLIAIMAVLIKRESPGPVFYRQTRLGLRDKPFQIIKLRSMRLDAEKEKGAVWTVENDPRRLKIGEFMRKWNIDELPQFWNVLVGEMSLVGPRPERPEFVGEFRDSVNYYNLRHCCKPGVTGWAAVHGLRGNTSLKDRLDFDLYYIEHWSLLLDFKIMLMTLAPPKNAY